ncbi:hypothetical protein [Acinetobacter sp. YH01008]|uniref:hypothetical protein n=1 Tax=Acinetobacter sp. YH01008 TaxID=2601024 RepID=UPI0015D14A5C|nr:hypothetical protein [Acinetobacter sp. YH01008]
MIKPVIQTFVGLFVLTSGLVIYYWRDIQYDPSNIELTLYFGILPLLLCLLLFTPYLIYKALKKYQQRKQKQQDQANSLAQIRQQDSENTKEPLKPIEDYPLNIFSAAAWHSFGKNAEILEKMMQFSSPELDSKLLNYFGLPLLAYRIHAIDSLLEKDQTEQGIMTSLSGRRIQHLIQDQLEQHQESLSLISRQLKHSALFYNQELAYQYRIHPGWTQENYQEDESHITPLTTAPVVRLNRLNLHILLADHLIDDWNEIYQKQLLSQIEQQYSIIPVQIHLQLHFLPADRAYSNWLNLIQESAGQSHEASLIIVADSEIDQDYLNDQLWQNEHYIASEYAASWCLAAPELEIEGMIPLQSLQVAKHVTHLQEYLAQHQVDLSTQLEWPQPFLVVLDEVTHSKKMKKIQKSFENIDFEPDHVVYPKIYLGHTQHLATVFAAMLSAHLVDNVITITYGLQQESTYLYFTNTKNDQLNQSTLVA